MTELQFQKLSADLRKLAKVIPLHWGAVQNNRIDDKINMFSIDSYEALETAVSRLSADDANYLRRRWYIWKCSECDEYLFYKNINVEKNPNRYDKSWDIRINNQLAFDVKGTVIPYSMRTNANAVIEDPSAMIRFFYEEQSKGRRFDMQNRLFIVHHSFTNNKEELYLRCAWEAKEKAYKEFVEKIDHIKIYDYAGCKAVVVFVLEINGAIQIDFKPFNLMFGPVYYKH